MQNITISYFLLRKFIKAVLKAFVDIIFVFFVDILSIPIIISSHFVNEVTVTLFKYLLFSQIHVLGFQI